jgi:hypothetical protein
LLSTSEIADLLLNVIGGLPLRQCWRAPNDTDFGVAPPRAILIYAVEFRKVAKGVAYFTLAGKGSRGNLSRTPLATTCRCVLSGRATQISQNQSPCAHGGRLADSFPGTINRTKGRQIT